MGDFWPRAEGGHDPGRGHEEQHRRHEPHRSGHDHRLPPDRPPCVLPGAPQMRGVDRGGLPHRVEGHRRHVHDLVGDGVRGHRRHPEPRHDRDENQRTALTHGEVGGRGEPRGKHTAQQASATGGGPQQRIPAHGEHAHAESHAPAQHGRAGSALDAVCLDQEGIADEDQSVREEGEPHRCAGVARALEDAVDELLGEEDGDAGQGDREVGGGQGDGRAALEHQPGQRLAEQEPARRDHRCDQRPQRHAATHGRPHPTRVPCAPGVRHQHGRAGAEDERDTEQHVLGVGRDGHGGDGGTAESGDPHGVDDPGGDGGQEAEVDGVRERDELLAMAVHR